MPLLPLLPPVPTMVLYACIFAAKVVVHRSPLNSHEFSCEGVGIIDVCSRRGIVLDWLGRVKRALLTGSAFLVGSCGGGDRVAAPRRILAFEPLEPRLPMSAAGLVPVGTQPEGGLSDKIAYIHPGHGWVVGDGFQRSEVPGTEMIEDLGTYDQMTFLADYLFRAGATVAPLRPVGHQTQRGGARQRRPRRDLRRRATGRTAPARFTSAARAMFRIGSPPLPRRKPRTRATNRIFRRQTFILSTRGRLPAATGPRTSFTA